MQKLVFMGAKEISDRIGVGRSRAHAITRDRDFPAPYQTLAMGSIWLASDVEAWIVRRRPQLAEDTEADDLS